MKHKIIIYLCFCLFLTLSAETVQNITVPDGTEKLLRAIRMVETGGEINRGEMARGDYSKSSKTYLAIGPYQIHWSYWKDASDYGKLYGKYEDCNFTAYSEKIVINYWRRYAKNIMNKRVLTLTDMEVLSRKHNGGGPSGDKKSATFGYWQKVKKILDRL